MKIPMLSVVAGYCGAMGAAGFRIYGTPKFEKFIIGQAIGLVVIVGLVALFNHFQKCVQCRNPHHDGICSCENKEKK